MDTTHRCPIGADIGVPAFAAIANGRQLARDLLDIHARWSEFVAARRTASMWRVLPMLLRQPDITSALIQKEIGLSQPAADNVIARLRDAGTVSKASGARRYVVWIAVDVTRALDDFVERARRRF